MRILREQLRESHNVGSDTPERIILPEVSPLMTMFHIELAGVSDAGKGFSIVRLRPRIGQVLACWAGRGEVLINGRWHECGPGMAYLTPPGQLHAYHTIPDERWQFAWVLWHTPPTRTRPLVDISAPMLVHADTEFLRSAIMGLYRESIGPCQPTVLDKWVELMQAYAARIGMQTPRRRRDLASLWEKVDTNLAHPWTCRQLAEEAGMSGETLRRVCQRENAHGPMHHLTELRMRRAAMLLESTQLKIDAIARTVGYSSAFAFSTAFKRHAGKPPAEYRKLRSGEGRRRHAVRSPRVDTFRN